VGVRDGGGQPNATSQIETMYTIKELCTWHRPTYCSVYSLSLLSPIQESNSPERERRMSQSHRQDCPMQCCRLCTATALGGTIHTTASQTS
jgi:hypothetical protein